MTSSPPSSRPALRSVLSGGSSPQHSHRDTTDAGSVAYSQTSTAIDHHAAIGGGGGGGAHIHFPQGLAPDGKEAAAGASSGGGKSGFKRTRTMSSDLGKGFKPKGASLQEREGRKARLVGCGVLPDRRSPRCGGSTASSRDEQQRMTAVGPQPDDWLWMWVGRALELTRARCLPPAAVGFDTFDDTSDDALFSFTLQGKSVLHLLLCPTEGDMSAGPRLYDDVIRVAHLAE